MPGLKLQSPIYGRPALNALFMKALSIAIVDKTWIHSPVSTTVLLNRRGGLLITTSVSTTNYYILSNKSRG